MVNPAIYPHKRCIPYEESAGEVDPAQLQTAEDGTIEPVFGITAGCAPDGMRFEDVGDCGVV